MYKVHHPFFLSFDLLTTPCTCRRHGLLRNRCRGASLPLRFDTPEGFLTWFLTTPAHPLRSSAMWPTTTLRLAFRHDGGDFRPNPPSITSNSETGASLPTQSPVSRFNATEGISNHTPLSRRNARRRASLPTATPSSRISTRWRGFRPNLPSITSKCETVGISAHSNPCLMFQCDGDFRPPPLSHTCTHFHGYGFAGVGELWEPQGYHWAVFVLGCLLPVHGRPTRKWAHLSTFSFPALSHISFVYRLINYNFEEFMRHP